MKLLAQHVEALIFTQSKPYLLMKLYPVLKPFTDGNLKKEEITLAVKELKERYEDDIFSFELNEIAGGYQFLSKKDYHGAIHVMLQLKRRKDFQLLRWKRLPLLLINNPLQNLNWKTSGV